MILDLQGLSGQSHAALHVVLAAVCRTGDDLAVLLKVLLDKLPAALIDGLEQLPAHISI